MNRKFYDATAVAGGGTISLEKGARGPVVDKNGEALTKVYIGGGWDMKSGQAKADFDLDLFAMCLGEGGKAFPWSANRVAFFNNKKIAGIECGPDNLTGAGAGDDESCNIDFSAVPADVHEIIVGINIYRAAQKNQNFGQVNNAFVRYAGMTNTAETIKKFDLTEDYSGKTCLLAFRFYRKDGEWRYQALGDATTGEINEVHAKYL